MPDFPAQRPSDVVLMAGVGDRIRGLSETEEKLILDDHADRLAWERGASNFQQVARRILLSAQRPVDDISAVMASPPTITDPTTTGNSTIITTATISLGGGRFNAENPLHVKTVGAARIGAGGMELISRGDFVIGGHGASYVFGTYASAFDMCMKVNGSSARWNVYVTDVETGVRARISANDRTQSASLTSTQYGYYKVDFGSRALRVIEIVPNALAVVRGINVATTDSIWPVDFQEPRIGGIGSSTWEGSMNDTNYQLKAAMADWLLAYLGCRAGWINGVSNTGVMSRGSNNRNNFQQRLDAGDMDYANIGHLDLLFVTGSTNDNTADGFGGTADDAAFQAAYTALVLRARQAQPRAILVGLGPTSPYGSPTGQSRYAAHKAGFVAATAGDRGAFYVDNGPDGGNYMFGTSSSGINQTIVGADTVHLGGLTGVKYYAHRLARDVISGLQLLAAS